MYWYAMCGRAQNTPFLKPEGEKVTFSFFSHAKRKENCVFHVLAGHGMCAAVHTLVHISAY